MKNLLFLLLFIPMIGFGQLDLLLDEDTISIETLELQKSHYQRFIDIDSIQQLSYPDTAWLCSYNFHVMPEINRDYTSGYVGGLILLNTFATLQISGDNMSENQRGIVALSGMVTASACYFIIEYINTKKLKSWHRQRLYW